MNKTSRLQLFLFHNGLNFLFKMPFVNQGIPRKHIPESQACLTFSVISESACVVE